MNLHPLAEIIPPASPEDFAALVASIAAVGQLEPIRTWNGLVLDGRHRLRACEHLGLPPRVREIQPDEVGGGTDEALLGYVLALNINRRHASPSQRAIAAAKAVTTERGGARRGTSFKAPFGALNVDRAAELFNVGARTVDRARQLLSDADARVVDLVASGVLTLSTALESHEQLTALATEQEERGVSPDFEALAKQIAKLKTTNAKLRTQNKKLTAAATNDQAKVYAGQLDELHAENARLQAQLIAADRGLTVAPPTVVFKENPEKENQIKLLQARLDAAEKAKVEALERAKLQAEQSAAMDAQFIDKSTRLAKLEAPRVYLTMYCTSVLREFNRNSRSALGAIQRGRVALTPEELAEIRAGRELLDALLDASADNAAVSGEPLRLLEVAQ